MCVVLYSAYYGITLTLTRAHWVRPQLHPGQRPPWPDLSCLSLYKIFVGSVPTCYSCPGALYFYIFVKVSAALPGMAIRCFRPWVSISPLRHLPLGWVTRLMGTYHRYWISCFTLQSLQNWMSTICFQWFFTVYSVCFVTTSFNTSIWEFPLKMDFSLAISFNSLTLHTSRMLMFFLPWSLFCVWVLFYLLVLVFD